MGKDNRFRLLLLLTVAFFICLSVTSVREMGRRSRLSDGIWMSDEFRSQKVEEDVLDCAKNADSIGDFLGVYWLEGKFGEEKVSPENIGKCIGKWEKEASWPKYSEACRAVWDDLKYFPLASETGSVDQFSFSDSWMYERSYKGERGHEGTDIMPEENRRGKYAVVSMTDGTVQNIGWLELGGYRIGIRAPGGAYFYYAHLDSFADIKEGDQVKAGDFLGYMGDTGYGPEGTRGKFPVHLHLGIYLTLDGQEISVNPYAPLCFVRDRQVRSVGEDEDLFNLHFRKKGF